MMANKFYGGYICNSGTGWIDVNDGHGNVETITYNDLDLGDTFADFCRKYGIAKDYMEYLDGDKDAEISTRRIDFKVHGVRCMTFKWA